MAGSIVAEVAARQGTLQAPVAFAVWFVSVALGCGVATGLLAGIIPARRATRLNPVATLAADWL